MRFATPEERAAQAEGLFTPRMLRTGTRRAFILTPEENAKYRAAKERSYDAWAITLTLEESGERYRVRSAPCGAGCHCDAVMRLLKMTVPA